MSDIKQAYKCETHVLSQAQGLGCNANQNTRDQTQLDGLMDSLHSKQDETHALIDQLTHKLMPFLRADPQPEEKARATPMYGVMVLDMLSTRHEAQVDINQRLNALIHRITD